MPTAQTRRSQPTFIIGTERSGSNLLRVILNSHPDLAVPHPPHVIRFFDPWEHRYGDLADTRNLRRLTRDVLRLVRAHIYPWTLPLDEDAIVRDASPRDLFGVYLALYDQYAAGVGKCRWCCKSTFMIDHVPRILEHCPDAKLIWLVRDPRDVALSSRNSVFNPCHPYRTALLWKRQQELGLRLEARLAPARLLRVHYEVLVTEPRQTVKTICRFVGVPYESAMLDYAETEEARRSAALSSDWVNTGSPILVRNAGKHREHMSAADVALVEQVAGAAMSRLGYEWSFARCTPVTWASRLTYVLQDACLRVAVEYRSIRRDRNAWRRWHRAATLAAIRMRLLVSGRRAPAIPSVAEEPATAGHPTVP